MHSLSPIGSTSLLLSTLALSVLSRVSFHRLGPLHLDDDVLLVVEHPGLDRSVRSDDPSSGQPARTGVASVTVSEDDVTVELLLSSVGMLGRSFEASTTTSSSVSLRSLAPSPYLLATLVNLCVEVVSGEFSLLGQVT